MAPAIRFSVLIILVIILVILLAYQCASQELTLTPSSTTACPGDEVNLVCHHPEVATNAQKYFSPNPAWRENSIAITLGIFGSRYLVTIAADKMSTTLTFTISADQSGRSYYDCALALARGVGQESSENVTVVIPELSSPVLNSASSLESSITVEWVAINCARSYNISWECTEPGSNGSISTTTNTTNTTNTMITVAVNGSTNCTLSVVAIDAEGSTGPNTAAAVYPGFPRPANASSSTLSCTNRSLLLTCQFGGGDFADIQWNSSRGLVGSSGGSLTINDATILQRGTEFWCSGVPVGGTATFRVTGESYVYSILLIVCSAIVGSSEPPEQNPDHGPLSSGQDRTLIIVLSAAAAVGGLLLVVVTLTAVLMVVCVLRSKSRSPVRTSKDDSCYSTVSGTPQPAAGNDIDMMNNPVYVPMECLRAGNRKEGVSEPGPIYVNL